MRRTWTLAATAAIAIALGVGIAASAAGMKPAELLEARVGLMQTVRSQLLAFVPFLHGGKLPADAAVRADNLAALAKIAPFNWGKGTEHLPHSKTKDAAFGAKAKQFQHGWVVLNQRSVALADAIKAGNHDAIRGDIIHIAKACKACHHDFRRK